MMNSEKLLKDLNTRLARFGDSDIAVQGEVLPESIRSSDLQRLYRETMAKLVFKIE